MMEGCFCACSPAELLWTPHWAESQLVHPHLWLFWLSGQQIAGHILDRDKRRRAEPQYKVQG